MRGSSPSRSACWFFCSPLPDQPRRSCPETAGLFVSLSVLGRLFALWLGAEFPDRWGCACDPGLLVYAALLGSVPLLTHPIPLALWCVALGGAAGFVAPLPTALIGDRVSVGLQAVAIGWPQDDGHWPDLGSAGDGPAGGRGGSLQPLLPRRGGAGRDGVAVPEPCASDVSRRRHRGCLMTDGPNGSWS